MSTLNETTFNKYFPNMKIFPSNFKIKVYNEDILSVLGEVNFDVKFQNKVISAKIFSIYMQVNSLKSEATDICKKIKSIKTTFSDVFKEQIGTIPEYEENFKLRNT